MKIQFVVIITTAIAVFFGIVVAQVSLSGLESALGTPSLQAMEGMAASDLISWFVYLMTFGMATVILFILTAKGNPLAGYRRAIGTALLASLLTIPEICGIAWGYVLDVRPDLLINVSLAMKGANFLSFPSLAIAILGDPQFVWLFSDLLFAIQFLMVFLLKTRNSGS